MVVKRRLNCGSNAFDFHNIPKAPRSSRRKVSCKRSDDIDNQISAIDLLASLAGKLLEESEGSSTSTNAFEGDNKDQLGREIKQEDDYNKPLKSESNSENTSVTCLHSSSVENDCSLKQTSLSDCKMVYGLKPLVGCESKKEDCDVLVESGSISEETGLVNVDAGAKTNGLEDGVLTSDKDPSQLPNDSFEGYGNHSKLVYRDDGENYCKYYKYSDKYKSYRPLTRVGNRRMKKSGMTKYGRPFARSKCYEDTKTGGCIRALYRKRKMCNGYNPWKHETVHRKRKLSENGLVINSDGGLSCESVSNSPQKGESGMYPSDAIGLHSEDAHVKFSIKSLKIPELFVEVPETATVGSLKRTVMEAVSALLSDGIRIGVLVQGKKVRDDNKTLSQAGLSCREKLGNLGFTLELGSEKLPAPLSSEIPVVSLPNDSADLSERSAASPATDSGITLPLQDADHLIHTGICVENSQELVPYQNDISADEQQQQLSSDSRALVPVSLESEALEIVPVNMKPKRTELSQRRTRRPFSVTEVEALVQAVEELGTGRWRDVKVRSFENASHRTYVDLKDKWKTLVHTASISPQQRRGEPVPQELLDRVLAAHTYWSQHQLKQNGKHTTTVVKSET